MHRPVARRLLAGAAVLTLSLTGLAAASTSAGASTSGPWVGAWAASPVQPDVSGISATGFTNQTVRDVVHLSAAGDALHVRLSNVFGTAPLAVTAVHVARRDIGPSTYPGTDHVVTYGGKPGITIPAGAEAVSDTVAMPVSFGTDLAVSIYFRGATGPVTWHPLATATNYVSTTGNATAQTSGRAYSTPTLSWYVLDGVDVSTSTGDGTVVAFGDSITDGYQATADANLRWPDDLARRIQAGLPQGSQPSVLDEGISGNRVLTDAGTAGVSAETRFSRDVLSQTGVKDVIILESINDIGTNIGVNGSQPVTAAQLIAGLSNLVRQAHAKGLRVIGATLTPYVGAGYATAAGERKREAVNAWIRTSGDFDAVVDFDAATRDPAHPTRFLPQYDSGDHLHPNDAGYQAMADAIDLSIL